MVDKGKNRKDTTNMTEHRWNCRTGARRWGFCFPLKGELGWSLRPCLLGADVELAHITFHQTDTEHELPFRGQILLRHGGIAHHCL